jgi:hypothetical protein
MTHLGAASFGIAVTAAVLVVYIGRPAAIAPAAPVEHQAPIVAEGKADRLPLLSRSTQSAPEPPPDPLPVLRAQLEPPAPPKPRADPVCGVKGRTWYTKDNGWKYWRCNR